MTSRPAMPPGEVDASLDAYLESVRFLNEEAAILDARRYEDWLALLDERIRYVMPVRVTRAKDDDTSPSSGLAHFDEDHHSLSKRVQRLQGDHAWTENPPSRTRRFVTNVRTTVGHTTDELRCTSYLLLFRSRLDIRPPEWLSMERQDVLRRVDGGLRLAERIIMVDEAVLRMQNLAVFL